MWQISKLYITFFFFFYVKIWELWALNLVLVLQCCTFIWLNALLILAKLHCRYLLFLSPACCSGQRGVCGISIARESALPFHAPDVPFAKTIFTTWPLFANCLTWRTDSTFLHLCSFKPCDFEIDCPNHFDEIDVGLGALVLCPWPRCSRYFSTKGLPEGTLTDFAFQLLRFISIFFVTNANWWF